MMGGLPRLKTVGVEGPYNVKGVSTSPSRERIFVCTPASAAEEAACANRIFTNLARRAYRRPVTAADVEAPMSFYKRGARSAAATSTRASARASRACSPAPRSSTAWSATRPVVRAGAAHPVSDVELASRLSFFLWSSIPDQQLMNLATAGRLRAAGRAGRAGARG